MTTPRIVHRTLEPEEVEKALAAGGPLSDQVLNPDQMREMSIAVVEVDGQIVAYWVVWYALHLEPLWIHPSWRKHPAVCGGIVQAMEAIVEASGEPAGFAIIEQENLETLAPLAQRLGFHEAPGKLFYVVVQTPELVKG